MCSYNIDTTTGPSYDRVHNVGLLESRRFWSEVSGVFVVSGVVLFSSGFLAGAVLSVTERGPT